MNSFYLAVGSIVILSFTLIYGSLFLLSKGGFLFPRISLATDTEVAAGCCQKFVSEDAIQSAVMEIIIPTEKKSNQRLVAGFESSASKVSFGEPIRMPHKIDFIQTVRSYTDLYIFPCGLKTAV
ncbi:MAG: hypothetical protein PHG89_04665 [Gallionella sp.]|nr:hypothetical protein [Gallionella sp.]